MHFSSYLPLALLPTALGQLNTLAQAKGKYFGSATDNGELSDAPYKAILSDTTEFGQLTPGNGQKWQYTEPTQGTFSYTSGDVVPALAAANGQKLRCHTLVWHSQLPNWVSSGTWTNATLIAAMKTHIQNLVTYYQGKCIHWDVVNEAFNEDGTYRTSVFYNIIGPEYIPIAFQTAAQYDPNTKLYLNDYNFEYNGAKAAAARTLVASLKARGIKIDGVGMQGHLIVGSTPGLSALTTMLQSFTALGVDVAYTELDIRFSSLPSTATGLAQQSTDYANVVGSCVATTRCVGVTIWDYTDKYSWIPSVFSGQGDALPWDANLVKKPAYCGIVTALGGTCGTSSTTTATATSTTLRTSTTTTVRTTTTSVRTSSTTTRTTTTTTAPATTSSGAVSPRWGQCGGLNWTGPTVCVAGTTCTYSNPWYSQCL